MVIYYAKHVRRKLPMKRLETWVDYFNIWSFGKYNSAVVSTFREQCVALWASPGLSNNIEKLLHIRERAQDSGPTLHQHVHLVNRSRDFNLNMNSELDGLSLLTGVISWFNFLHLISHPQMFPEDQRNSSVEQLLMKYFASNHQCIEKKYWIVTPRSYL